jgi:two-component system, LytTR family, sensor histidine kinase AlgZ
MSSSRSLVRCLIVNTTLALIPPFLVFALAEHPTAQRLRATLAYSLIYSHCIGTLAFATIPRIWMRTLGITTWLRWPLRVGTMFAASIAGSLIAGLVFIALGWQSMDVYWAQFTSSLKIATFITVVAGAMISMYESFRARLEESTLQLRTKELEREHALKLATEAQLASLESRIHPHFLFNTLNSISSLIPEDPKRAERLVEQISALLRFSLDAHQSGLVPLAREMKIVADYLEIERARFGDRLRYQIDLAPDLAEARVPPLAVQTLVENSVKHAISQERLGGELRVTGARDNGLLRLDVLDQGPEFSLEAAPAGHGLDILRGRLATLFGDRAALMLERRDQWNRVTLSVPQNANGHESVPGR